MSSENILDKVKKIRELTGVGFKDCKIAIDESNGDIDKAIEFLRIKGISKASKKMERIAADGLVSTSEKENKISLIEINSETDFVAKNNDFISFVKEVSNLALLNSGQMDKIKTSVMKNNKTVNDNLIALVSKIGEKITLRRSDFVDVKDSVNFSYVHSPVKENLGKIGVLVSLKSSVEKGKLSNFGKQLCMHIAALSPLGIDEKDLDPDLLQKEKEIIIEELKISGKDPKIVEKIAAGKINKFINDNTLLNQEWIIEPKKKVKDVIIELDNKSKIEIKKFVRFKVGEGV